MSWSILNSVSAQNLTNSSLDSAAIDTSSADLIIVGASGLNSSNIAISDSSTNTWLVAISTANNNPAVNVQVWYAQNPITSTGHTFSLVNTNGFAAMSALAVKGSLSSGSSSVGSFDVENYTEYQSNGNTDLSPGSITTSSSNELAVVFVNIYNDASMPTVTMLSSWTNQTHVDCSGNNFGMVAFTSIQASAATINSSVTRSPGQPNCQGGDWGAIVTFKPAAVTGSVGAVAGSASVTAVGASQFRGVGAVAGHTAVAGVGAANFAGVGSIAGHATVAGVGAAQFSGVGLIAGSAAVSAVGSAGFAGVGSIAGHATVLGIGSAVLPITATLAAIERGDQALVGLSVYNTPANVLMGVTLKGTL